MFSCECCEIFKNSFLVELHFKYANFCFKRLLLRNETKTGRLYWLCFYSLMANIGMITFILAQYPLNSNQCLKLNFSCFLSPGSTLKSLNHLFLIFFSLNIERWCLSSVLIINVRSSRPEVFYKLIILKNFAKFTGKHLFQILFSKKVWSCEIFTNAFFLQNTSSGFFWNVKFPKNFYPISFRLRDLESCLNIVTRTWKLFNIFSSSLVNLPYRLFRVLPFRVSSGIYFVYVTETR